MTGMSESLKDHFLFFSSKYYANHPWHHHSQKIKEMGDKFVATIADLQRFCEEAFTFYEKIFRGGLLEKLTSNLQAGIMPN